jgi:hypothetical protein
VVEAVADEIQDVGLAGGELQGHGWYLFTFCGENEEGKSERATEPAVLPRVISPDETSPCCHAALPAEIRR